MPDAALAQWAETVGGEPLRDWTQVADADLAAEFERELAEVMREAPRPELMVVETAPGAIRVRHSGGSITQFLKDGEEADLREFVVGAAITIGNQYLEDPPF